MGELKTDYICPDGCEPFPDSIWARVTDDSLSATLERLGDQLPGQPGFTLEKPMLSADERYTLETSVGIDLADLLDKHLQSL